MRTLRKTRYARTRWETELRSHKQSLWTWLRPFFVFLDPRLWMRGGTPLGCSVSPFITRLLSCNYACCVTAQFAMKSHMKQGPGSSSCGPLDSDLHLLWKIWAQHHLGRQTEVQHAALRHSEVAGSQYRDPRSFWPPLFPTPFSLGFSCP